MRKRKDPIDEIQYTLITNISFTQASFGDGKEIRLHTAAVLVEHGKLGLFERDIPQTRIRGFGTDGSWPIFDVWLGTKAMPYKLTPAQSSNAVIFSANIEEAKPIFSGSMLTFADNDFRAFLQTEDDARNLDVYQQTGDIVKIWQILSQKTVEYWRAPNLPIANYIDANVARFRMKSRGVV